MSYSHFTLSERKYLQQLLSEGLSIRKTAQIPDRSPSSVSREIKRNRAQWKPHKKPDSKYWYNHRRAQNLYIRRRRVQRRTALQPGSDIWNYISDHLRLYWSPEAISKRWSREHQREPKPGVSTIYRYIKLGLFPQITEKCNLRRRGKRMLPRNACYNSIQPDRIIPEWTEEIQQRLRLGDWERDTVYGGVGKGLLVTPVDRKSRYLRMGRLISRSAVETGNVIEKLLTGLPVNSVSLDNGSGFSEFHKLEEGLNAPVYFAQPHKPWQRGTNENTNGLIRFFFPKGFDFRAVTDEEIQAVEDLLNNRQSKCLDWKTPSEVFLVKGVALA